MPQPTHPRQISRREAVAAPRPSRDAAFAPRPPRCVALIRARGTDCGWRLCSQRVVPATHFCRRHRDAIDGCVMGWRQFREAQIAARS
jgi:hypothetical protein